MLKKVIMHFFYEPQPSLIILLCCWCELLGINYEFYCSSLEKLWKNMTI